jgi:hypothetical protein
MKRRNHEMLTVLIIFAILVFSAGMFLGMETSTSACMEAMR